jgi:hypothetical protein
MENRIGDQDPHLTGRACEYVYVLPWNPLVLFSHTYVNTMHVKI